MTGLHWRLRWEADLSPDDHAALAATLARIFPAFATTFRDRHSWSGAIPEGRIIGYAGSRPVSHLGFLRRTLRVEGDDSSLLVGDVGLVGVDPHLHRSGVGRRLLEECAATFHRLALPFGFLTCRPAVVPFYESGGWRQLPGQVTRLIDNGFRVEAYTGPAMVLPVAASLDDWPCGRTVIRDGLEV